MTQNDNQSNQNKSNKYINMGLAIAFLCIAALLFFGWNMFADSILLESILKLLALPFALFGFVGIGSEISGGSNDYRSALLMGIGLGFSLSGMMVGFLPISMMGFAPSFPSIWSTLALFVVSFGFVFIIFSIIQLLKVPKNSLSVVQRSIIIIGQLSASILFLMKFIYFLIG